MALTEEAWLHYSNPSRMKRLKWVEEHWTPRKKRLFSVACSRWVWDALNHPALRKEADVHVLRGLLALEAGEPDAAEQAFRRAMSIWSEQPGTGLDFNGRVVARYWLERLAAVPGP